MRSNLFAQSAALLVGVITFGAMVSKASATLLVYEPFDYPDAALTGQGGALGTTGTWTTNDSGFAEGWWCHPEGELTGQFDDIGGGLNMFDGTVDNLPTAGGFVGSAGPEEQGGTAGTRNPTGNMDANIGLDPSVTATFQSGTTTWFSYVGAHADNRNQGSPTFMLCTDPTVDRARGLTMQNSGNGIGGVGGPTRFNLQDVYPHYFSGGMHHQTPGGYLGGVFGAHEGIVTAFCSTPECDGVLDETGQPRTQTMAWQIRDDNGFGAPNIVVGKIEWDADTGGEDIISVVRFLETEELSEAAFDALVAASPPLSSANWESNKPNLDQSQFDLINISSLKFYVDELRIATTFGEVVGGGASKPQLDIDQIGSDLVISWDSQSGMLYNLRSETDPSNGEPKDWAIFDGNMDIVATPPSNTLSFPLPADSSRYFVIEEFPAPPVTVFSDDFEQGQGAWTMGSDGDPGSEWELGTPSNVGPATTNSGVNCFGTDLDDNYAFNADVWLRSPAIDLTTATAATLKYAESKNMEGLNFDFGTINVLNAADDSILGEVFSPIEGDFLEWETVTRSLPAEALGKVIKIEFRMVTDNFEDSNYPGWYIDDVEVTTPAP